MTNSREVFGLATKDGERVITASEADTTARLEMGHVACNLGPDALRALARRLYELARRIEARNARAAQ